MDVGNRFCLSKSLDLCASQTAENKSLFSKFLSEDDAKNMKTGTQSAAQL